MVGTTGYLVVSILGKMLQVRLKELTCHSCSQAMGLVAGILTLAQTQVLIPQMVLAFRPYEAQDWEIHFFSEGTSWTSSVGRSMVLGHLIGLG